jgi:hypothetical protein
VAFNVKLKQFQTNTPYKLETRAIGTYNERLLIEGNSLISTVYIKSMDVGASLEVNFWEYTTGAESGERRDIKSHPTFNLTSETPHLLVVAPFHNSPQVECIVAGGNVEFSVHLTCVSSFASAQDNSLILDGATFEEDINLAQPVACLDDETGLLNFLRCRKGVLPTDPINQGDPFEIVGEDTLTAGSTNTLTSFTVAGSERMLSRIAISSFHPGRWFLENNATLLAAGRIGAGNYNHVYDFTPRRTLEVGDEVVLKYTARAGQDGSDIDYQIIGSDLV